MSRLHSALHGRKATFRGGKTAAAALGGAAVAIAATLVVARPAGAFPAGLDECNSGTVTFTPASGWVPLTGPIAVSVPASTSVKADVAADASVVSGAEIRLGWEINSSNPFEGLYGPANFADHQEFAETRSAFGIINVSAGTTVIQPFVRVSGPSGASATILHRCLAGDPGTTGAGD